MRKLICGLAVCAACGTPITPTTSRPVVVVVVEVYSTGTQVTRQVAMSPEDPQAPSCAWRDLVVKRHIGAGGLTNDIVILTGGYRVFIQANGGGYRLYDEPTWCQ